MHVCYTICICMYRQAMTENSHSTIIAMKQSNIVFCASRLLLCNK